MHGCHNAMRPALRLRRLLLEAVEAFISSSCSFKRAASGDVRACSVIMCFHSIVTVHTSLSTGTYICPPQAHCYYIIFFFFLQSCARMHVGRQRGTVTLALFTLFLLLATHHVKVSREPSTVTVREHTSVALTVPSSFFTATEVR
jgi:hypothetical protein